MKTANLVIYAAIALAAFLILHKSPDSKAEEMERATHRSQYGVRGTWFHASPRMEIVDNRPQITDAREQPETPQLAQLRPLQFDPLVVADGTVVGGWPCARVSNGSLDVIIVAAPDTRAVPEATYAYQMPHNSVGRHLLAKLIAREQCGDGCTPVAAGTL
jgi:hypothetical protein